MVLLVGETPPYQRWRPIGSKAVYPLVSLPTALFKCGGGAGEEHSVVVPIVVLVAVVGSLSDFHLEWFIDLLSWVDASCASVYIDTHNTLVLLVLDNRRNVISLRSFD